MGFQDLKFDVSLFLYNSKVVFSKLQIYVDDIMIIGNSSTIISKLVNDLNKSFLLKDLNSLHFFLGIEVFIDK